MGAELDRRIARIAGRQHGVVTRGQLEGAGVGRGAIALRVRTGRLHRLHRGVYAVGHAAPSLHRDFAAAVLACGESAVLSHLSAAYLWGFLRSEGGPVHVTSPSTSGKLQRAGIVLHRSPSLREKGMTTFRERIPVTTPRRTIEDLEDTIEPYLYRRAKSQAEFMKFRLNLPSDRTRSDLERDFLRFLAKHGFPPPEVNVNSSPVPSVTGQADQGRRERGVLQHASDRGRRAAPARRARNLDNYPDEIAVDLGEVLGRGTAP